MRRDKQASDAELRMDLLCSLNPVQASSQADVHQDDVRLLTGGGFNGFLSRRSNANHIAAHVKEDGFDLHGDKVVILHD